jgi:hypothetical protein
LGGHPRRRSRSGSARPGMNAKGSSYAPTVNKMSLARLMLGPLPLRRNRPDRDFLGNSLGVKQGLSAGFHGTLRARES